MSLWSATLRSVPEKIRATKTAMYRSCSFTNMDNLRGTPCSMENVFLALVGFRATAVYDLSQPCRLHCCTQTVKQDLTALQVKLQYRQIVKLVWCRNWKQDSWKWCPLARSDVIMDCDDAQVSLTPVDGATISHRSVAVLRPYQHKPHWEIGANVFIQNLSSCCHNTAETVLAPPKFSVRQTVPVRWGATQPTSLPGVHRHPVPVLYPLVQIHFLVFSQLNLFRFLKSVCTTHKRSVATYSDGLHI